ncbi:uncharacterized protein LOC136096124 [Hydra vulgaris]|uniref:uncharacterized protein LOC136096124 n=1 Tax=Hydra vulgaris TaxID=6087 RepID=UPI0032E9DC05
MSSILGKVLSLDAGIGEATDHYIDDIIVDLKKTSVENVVNYLERYGLLKKEPEECDGARRLFSICGHFIGHYPIRNWLRFACSFTKRYSHGDAKDDLIGDQAQSWLVEIMRRLEASDPVKGTWNADGIQNGAILWCDVSSIAMGVAIEFNGVIVEDAAWLRSINDVMHFNTAELDTVVRGINLAVKWDIKNLLIFTDLVHGWLKSVLTESHRVRSNGLSKMLIKRRLSLLRDLIKEYSTNSIMKWVPSSKNKADVLTRVSKKWLYEISRKIKLLRILLLFIFLIF